MGKKEMGKKKMEKNKMGMEMGKKGMENSKFYKCEDSDNTNMLPGDRNGSSDESFFSKDKNKETLPSQIKEKNRLGC